MRISFPILALVVFSAWTTYAGVLVNYPFTPQFENPTSVVGSFEAADDFTLTNFVTIRALRFWGLFGNPKTDDFIVRIFADTNGYPAALPLTEQRVGRAQPRFAQKFVIPAEPEEVVYKYNRYFARLPEPVELAPGRYWLSVVNDTHGMGGWGIGTKAPGPGHLHFRDSPADAWFVSVPGYGIAFKLLGVKLKK